MHPNLSLSARSRRYAGFAAHLAVAVAALVVLLCGQTGVAQAATSGSWTDPSGDAPSGVPDIRSVDLVRNDATFRWTIAAPNATRLAAGTFVWISLRADDDAHLIEIDASANRITHYDWDSEKWTPRWVDVLTSTITYPLQVVIDRAALGDPSTLRFTVTTALYNAVASQPWSSDTTDVMTLDLGTTPAPAPAVPGAPDVPVIPTAPALPSNPAATPGSAPDMPAGGSLRGAPGMPPGADGPSDAPGVPTGVPVLPGGLGDTPANPARPKLRLGGVAVARRGAVATVRLAVVNASGQLVRRGRVRCSIRIAGRAVAPLSTRFAGGHATCRLRLARGRTARVTVRVDAAGTSVTKVVIVRRAR